MDSRAEQHEPSIGNLFPELTSEQLKEAEANLRAYFEIALAICSSIDTSEDCSTMKERSKVILKN